MEGEEQPCYLLGIPFMQLMGASVFLQRLRIFTMASRYGDMVPIVVWLVVIWLVCLAFPSKSAESLREPATRAAFPILPEEVLLLLVGVIAVGHVFAQFASSGDMREAAAGGVLGFLSMILGYFLVRDIVRRATPSEVMDFLGLVVIANTVAAALFVLHQGLHIHVYGQVEYSSVVFGGTVITRDFGFAPQLSALALAYVLARRRWTGRWLCVLVITALSIWVSYTRGLLLVIVVAFAVALLAPLAKRPDLDRFLRRAIAIVAVGVVMLWVVLAFLPTDSAFFAQRIRGFSGVFSGRGVANWGVRTNHFLTTEKIIAAKSVLFGAGFPSTPEAVTVYHWSADMAWIGVVYREGLVGLVLFGLIFAWFGVRAYGLFLARSGEAADLELIYLITLLLAFVSSFDSWTFMASATYPMGLWLLALMAAEALRPGPSYEVAARPLAVGARNTRAIIP